MFYNAVLISLEELLEEIETHALHLNDSAIMHLEERRFECAVWGFLRTCEWEKGKAGRNRLSDILGYITINQEIHKHTRVIQLLRIVFTRWTKSDMQYTFPPLYVNTRSHSSKLAFF